MPTINNTRLPNTVYGKITDANGTPLADLKVEIYDVDMRDWQALAATITGSDGTYELSWTHDQLRGRDVNEGDIAVKVFTREKGVELYRSSMDEVRFNASSREEINITITTEITAEIVEYDHIYQQATYLAADVAITDLQENAEYRDVTFLSKEAEIPTDKIQHLIVAHRLQSLSKIDAPFFYALLRKNTLLKADYTKPFQVRLAIDMDTDPQPLLFDAALADEKTIRADIQAAVKELIVSTETEKKLAGYLEQLQAYKQRAEEYYKNDRQKQVIGLVSNFFLNDKVDQLVQLYQDNKDNPVAFLGKLNDPSFFNPAPAAGDDETTAALQQLLASRKADNPTATFTARLQKEKSPTLKNHDAITGFLSRHPDFDLHRHNITAFLKDKKLDPKESDSIAEELKSIQRVVKLVPHYDKAMALHTLNMRSAHSIAAAGESRFVKEIAPKAGIAPKEAKDIFQKAQRKTTAAMMIAGELQDTLRAKDIPALEMKTLSAKLEAVSQDFPNLKSLFKLVDTCACEDCRSVYSPAAYLVEILQFLDKRSVTDLTVLPHTTGHLAKDVLFGRRPDLGDIDLGCENAMTPVPYIDLVCELMEEAIAPDAGVNFTGVLSDGADPLKGRISNALLTALTTAGLPVTGEALIFETETTTGSPATLPHYLRDKDVVAKIVNTGGNNYTVFRLRQTLSTAEELAAAPEYVNTAAYDLLKTANFAFSLPFDLDYTEAGAYFDRFDIARATLMEDFQSAGNPTNEAIAAERLSLTDAGRTLIITPKATIVDQQSFWNAPPQWDTPPITGNVLDYMKRVDHFLDKTGLAYKDLDWLLTLTFIDPAGNLFIQNLDLGCDTAQKTIAGLDEAGLDRIHRFLRLQKITGWSLAVTDAIISQTALGNGTLNDACLVKAAALRKISAATGIKIDELIGFYGEIPHTWLTDNAPQPLYQNIFLNKAKNGFIDEGLLPANVTGAQPLANFTGSLAVCLQIKEQDLNKLLPLLPDGQLSFANLSRLLAASRLMRKLRLSADDYVILTNLTGIQVSNSPADTQAFVDAANNQAASPLKLADVLFMIRHEATNLADREIKDEKVTALLQQLQTAYQANFTANQSLFNPNLSAQEQQETLQNVLAKISTVTEDDVKTFVKFIDRNWSSANDAKTFTDSKLASILDTTVIKAKIDALAAAPGPDLSLEQDDLVKAFLDSIAAYQLQTGKQTILVQALTSTFKSDPGLVSLVLEYALLKQPAPGTSFVDVLLSDDTLIDINPAHSVPILPAITPAAFPDQYRAVRLLHKLFPLINAFQPDNTATEWFLKNNKALGWLEWDSIPYEAGQTAVGYPQYIAFAQLFSLLTQLTPVPNPADIENPISFFTIGNMLLPASGATRDQFIGALALLTGYDKDDLDAIDARLFAVFSLANYQDPKSWKAVMDGAEDLRKLGSPLTQVLNYIKPVLSSAETALLRAALKARYDEDTWLSTLKEIMDAVRPQKRDVLIAYLLAENPDMKTADDLYDYFLVDVEMEACMPSSRIVQAHGSIQLFVQRCLMGLEPKAAADVSNDAAWTQWAWMKNYRVWEANRMVFLYPENWMEPELRDDKSFLFQELENELQQNELTDDTAEQGFIHYLEKLDDIAFLEVVATWYQTEIKTMHVFARTKGGDPAIYYYRTFVQERSWTPWEKVELDITDDHLLAFVHNSRLCLAWPVFSKEADPNPQSTIPSGTAGTVVNNDKPKQKLKIQLAVSEYGDNKWQPKKISKDAILTPNVYTVDDSLLQSDKYNLMFFEPGEQIWLYTAPFQSNNIVINGIFNITGCKGYPELAFQGYQGFPDFFPDFKDTLLETQRYDEQNKVTGDDLAVRNAISIFAYYEILQKTPGTFRLTYPQQFTLIDLVALLFEFLVMKAYGVNTALFRENRILKIPLGTLLPYFDEDSKHNYVIVPGFYSTVADPNGNAQTLVQRSGSDVMQLIEDIIALFNKYMALYKADPDINALLTKLFADTDFQDIVTEIEVYFTLKYGEQFKNMYHPLMCSLRKTLYKDGVPALMKRETQLQTTTFDFGQYYDPNKAIVPKTYVVEQAGVKTLSWPIEDLDFSSDGAYSGYNWELFYHVPLLIATRLSQNQQFEDALTWFHYMFNPTGALAGDAPEKYWITKPFYQTHTNDYIAQRIDKLLYKIADPGTPEIKDLEFAIDEWRNNPFKPYTVARFRPVAYQKALLMKYLDNLTSWGDYLFRQDTMESVVQATQMYIMADKLLGPKPRIVPSPVKQPYETYNQIEAKIDAFGNALIDLENILPDFSVLPEGGAELPPPPVTLSMLYFCIPENDKMLSYWDLIADRLFNIRHCRNIDGVERSLALFAPPIDPGMLVRAAAAGLDLSSVIAGLNAPTPYYRFITFAQKATELAQEVRTLGLTLLSALERKDAEAFAQLRNDQDLKLLNAVRDSKLLSVKDAETQIEVLQKAKATVDEKHTYYANIQKIIDKEQLNLDKLAESHDYQMAAQVIQATAGVMALIPDFAIGASGFGGSPHAAAKWGGSFLAHSATAASAVLSVLSTAASYEANRASILGGYDRRFDDWQLQTRLAQRELDQVDKQIASAGIRKDIADADLKSHDIQIENNKKTTDFMQAKFTNQQLYNWLLSQVSAIYFKSYQLAFEFAKKAERCYRFELGNDDFFISYGYWDSMKKGLQCADQLIHDIKRMQTTYLEKNKREYEITKNVSLAQLDPLALIRLKTTGISDFEVPEALYDIDFPGHYFRRIRTVNVSLPCVAGPYTSISARLSLTSNRYRKNTNPDNSAATGYAEDPGNDERFMYNVGAIQSVASSNAQNDAGMFELNFKDERYLPFELCGAISNWRLELPGEVRQFDYETISDLILQIKYTAREGGSSLQGLAEASLKDRLAAIKQQLGETGLHLALDLKNDLPNQWLLLRNNGTVNLSIDKSRLPYLAQTLDATIVEVMFVAQVKNNPASFTVNVDGTPVNLARVDDWQLCKGTTAAISLDTAFDLSVAPAAQLNNLQELMLVVKYSF